MAVQKRQASSTSVRAPVRPSIRQVAIQAIQHGLKLAFAGGLIFWMVRNGTLNFTVLRQLATPDAVLIALALIFVLIFVNNYRWLALLRAQGFASSVRHTLPLSLIGIFFNYAMPGGVGGDVVKGYYLVQENRQKSMAAVVSILMDRVIGFCMMIMTAALALVFSWDMVLHSPQMKALASAVFLLAAGFLVFFCIALSRRIGRSPPMRLLFEKVPGGRALQGLYEKLHGYRHAPGALLTALSLSLVSQFSIIIFVYLIARKMGVDEIPFSAYCFLVPVGMVTMAIPISPAGVGVGQAAFLFLFKLYLGRESQVGPTAVTALQITQFAWGLLGAFFYLRRGKPRGC